MTEWEKYCEEVLASQGRIVDENINVKEEDDEKSLYRELTSWLPQQPKPNRPTHKLVPYLGLHGKSQFLYCEVCGKKEAELFTSVYCEDTSSPDTKKE